MKKQPWQQKLKEENEELLFANRELHKKISTLSKEVELLRKYSNINPDPVETIGRVSSSIGDAVHTMSNFVSSMERMRR